MVLWFHTCGHKQLQTTSHIHITCIQSVLAPWYAVDGHMGAPLHCYTSASGGDFFEKLRCGWEQMVLWGSMVQATNSFRRHSTSTQRPKRRNSQRDSDENCTRTEDVLAITLRQEFFFWCKVWRNFTENKPILEQTVSVSMLRCDQNHAFSRIAPLLTSPLLPKFALN